MKKHNPWIHGPPPYASHLPGGSCTISFRPPPKWPIEHRNVRGLHGALTALIGVGHIPHTPWFSLFPYGSGWGVHFWHEAGLRLAGKSWNGTLYDRPTEFSFGPLFRIKAPTVEKRGHQRVRLTTITPVCLVSMGRTVTRTHPTAKHIAGTLTGDFLRRLGLEYMRDRDLVRVTTLSRSTQPTWVYLGGKFGRVEGFDGSCDLEVNAPARWLLEAAARVGLGSRTGFGFGRIRLEPLP